MIATLVSGNLVPCPKRGTDGNGKFHTNLPLYYEHHLDVAMSDGYYPVKFTDKPEGNYRESWNIQLDDNVMKIVQIWTEYTPEPEPMPVDIEKLRSDVDYIAMMTDVDLEGVL